VNAARATPMMETAARVPPKFTARIELPLRDPEGHASRNPRCEPASDSNHNARAA